MSERIGRQVLQLPCGQKDDVGEASEGLKASGSDDGGLKLAVDVLGHGIAGAETIGGKNPAEMGLQGFAQAFEGFQATAPGPGDPGSKQGLGIFSGRALLMNLLVALFYAPGPGGLQP